MVRQFLFTLLFFITPAWVFAVPQVQKTVLDNGLTVLVSPMPSSQMVSIYAYIKTGSATEGRFLGTGISHFIEHMLFKGTKRRGVGEIAKEVKALGGRINASTDLDYTIVTLDLPKEELAKGLDLIADMLRHSVFDPKEVEKERQVIHGEMRLYYDNPLRRLSVNVFKNVYKHHPYRHTTIGYEQLFDGISREDLYGYYQRNYIPNNMVIAVAGGLDAKETLGIVKKHFDDFKPRPYVQRNLNAEPLQISERLSKEFYRTPFYWFSLAFGGVGVNDPDIYALDLLSLALGSGEGSRLNQEIYKEKKLVNQISCSDFTPYDKGLFEFEGMMEKDNLAQVKNAVLKIIDDVKRRGLTKEELKRVKAGAKADLIFGNQTSSSVAYKLAVDEGMTGDAEFSLHYPDALENVTNDDIKRVAGKYLNASSLNVTLVYPLSARPKEADGPKKMEKAGIKQIVLKNGLTLLLKEDHTYPFVSIQAVLNGGLRSENKDNNGIAALFSAIWSKATKHRSLSTLSRELEERAANLSSYSGLNNIGLSGRFLSKDLDFGMDLLSDIIKDPVFLKDEFELARKKLISGIDNREDDVRALTVRRAMELLYTQHPYHMDVMGTKSTLNALTLSDMRAYYQRMIRPSNMVIAVFGDIDTAKVGNALQRSLEGVASGDVVIPAVNQMPPQSVRSDELKKDKDQAVVVMAFLAPDIHSKDRFAMEVVNAALGGGLGGRLFVKVRDQLGKAYTVGSSYTPDVDTGNIVLFCLTTNAKVDSVKAIIRHEIEDLASVPMTDEELRDLKAALKGRHRMSLDTIGNQAVFSAFNTLDGLGFDFDDRYNGLVDRVSQQDVQNVVKKYLDPRKAVEITTLGNHKK